PTKYSAIGLLGIVNHGRTVAFPESIDVGWMVTPRLPDVPQFKNTEPFKHADTIKPNEEFMSHSHFGIELTEEEQREAETGHSWLWFYGCIYYKDFLGQLRDARFCWRFANRNEDMPFYSFASDGNPPAAYKN
ncbi:MAG TPA: hypothetical protein VL181_10760, partial [Holophagaceae bacterium]|nr:hypothetical protein [Holophagaceae bacterium]